MNDPEQWVLRLLRFRSFSEAKRVWEEACRKDGGADQKELERLRSDPAVQQVIEVEFADARASMGLGEE